MRLSLCLAAATALSITACAPYGPSHVTGYAGAPHTEMGHVQSGYAAKGVGHGYSHCGGGTCAPGAGYGVAPAHLSAPQHHAPAQFAPQHIGHSAPYGAAVAPHVAAPYKPGGLRGLSHAHDRGYVYGELGGIAYDIGEDFYGIQGRVGYQTKSVLGVEAEGSFGVIGEDVTDVATGIEVETDVNYSAAAFLRARFPVGDRFAIMPRVGYHVTEVGAEAGGVSVDDDFDGIAYGAGAEYAIAPRSAIRADYTRYDGGSDVSGSLEAVSLGWVQRF